MTGSRVVMSTAVATLDTDFPEAQGRVGGRFPAGREGSMSPTLVA